MQTLPHHAPLCRAIPDNPSPSPVVWIQTDLVRYGTRMEDTSPDIPERVISPDMLAAYNMARWRRECDMTQERLGEELGGWTRKAVSAAEHSWDGKRVRQFDAALIVRLARIFGIPVPGMLMPPPDDGEAFRYVVDAGGSRMAAGEFFASLMADSRPAAGSRTGAREAYARELTAAVARYMDPAMRESAARGLRQDAGEERLDSALRRAVGGSGILASLQDALSELRSDNELLREFLTATLRDTAGGRERLAALDREQRQRALDGIGTRWRTDQSRLAALGREMFGDRGPATREEIDQVGARARERGLRTHVPVIRQRLTDGSWEIPDPGEAREAAS